MNHAICERRGAENTASRPAFVCGFDDGACAAPCQNPAPDDASFCSQHDPEVVTIERSYLVRVVQTYTGRLPENHDSREADIDQFVCENFVLVGDETETVEDDELHTVLRHPDDSIRAL